MLSNEVRYHHLLALDLDAFVKRSKPTNERRLLLLSPLWLILQTHV